MPVPCPAAAGRRYVISSIRRPRCGALILHFLPFIARWQGLSRAKLCHMDTSALLALLRMPLPQHPAELDARQWARLKLAVQRAAAELERHAPVTERPATLAVLSSRPRPAPPEAVTVDRGTLDALFGLERQAS